MKGSKLTKITYGLDDIGIIQAPISYCNHRGDVNPFITVCNREMYPIFASPMDSVIDENNYKIFIENKITPVIPRTVQQRLSFDDRLKLSLETFVSFSLDESKELFNSKFLENLDGVSYICIDLANGTLSNLYKSCRNLKDKFGDKVVLMTGNVNTELAYAFYANAGISYMRLNIGSGSRCTTACAVGIYKGAATAIDDMRMEKEKWIENHPDMEYTKIIVDGGINWYDKIQKSIALGADGVMIGELFAECEEACGPIGYAENENDFVNGCTFTKEEYKVYKNMTDDELLIYGGSKRKFLIPFRMYSGMSHRSIQKKMGGDGSKVSEGICKPVKVKHSLAHWVNNMNSYLRSCMTYTDSSTIDELKNAEVVILGNNGKLAYSK